MTEQQLEHITTFARRKHVLETIIHELQYPNKVVIKTLNIEYVAGASLAMETAISLHPTLQDETLAALLGYYKSQLAAVEAEIESITVCYSAAEHQ